MPRLSVLREMANIGAFETSAIDTIARLISEGRLPGGKECMISHCPTSDWVEVEISCERTHVKGDVQGGRAFLAGMSLIFALVEHFSSRGSGPAEHVVHGRDTTVVVPLRIERSHHRSLRGWGSGRRLRSLLAQIPAVAALFDEYPSAKVVGSLGYVDEKTSAYPVGEFLS